MNPVWLVIPEAYCDFCRFPIKAPRRLKGEIVQRFCNRKCKDAWHNSPRLKANMDSFVREVKALSDKLNNLLKTYGLDR
jgi:hypothetical protein